MIPLGDSTRHPIHVPVMTLTILAVNASVFILELSRGETLINRWSLVPAIVMTPHGFLTIFTSMFMHAGWVHFLGNMLFFWAFAPQIEDVMGPVSFLIFYLLGGVVAALAQVVVDLTSTIPSVGASGAIVAVMGAFLVTYPRDRIRTAVILLWSVQVTFLPAIAMVGLWFVTQLFNQVGALAQMQTDLVVMYVAHVGGLVYGTLACWPFESRRRLQVLKREQRSARGVQE